MSNFKIMPGDYVNVSDISDTDFQKIVEAFVSAGGKNHGDTKRVGSEGEELRYLMIDSRSSHEVWTYPNDTSDGMKREISVSDILGEDRTNWHPHADVIIAWAKGEKIQSSPKGLELWESFPADFTATPKFCEYSIEWRIKPDNSEEIDRIKQEIQDHGKAIDELQATLKELEA